VDGNSVPLVSGRRGLSGGSILTIEAIDIEARAAEEVSLYFGAAREGAGSVCWRTRRKRGCGFARC